MFVRSGPADSKSSASGDAVGPDRLRDEIISDVTRQVREHLDAQRFDDASTLLADALERYPDDLILQAVSTAVDAAARRRATSKSSAPGRRVPLFPLLGIVLTALAAGGLWFFLLKTPDRQFAETPDSARKPRPAETADVESLEEATALAVRDHSWDEARTWVSRLSELKPGDTKIKGWLDDIALGSAEDRRIADLRSTAQTAIRTRNWGEAQIRVALLLKAVPDDPDAREWQQLLADGRRGDLVVSETAVRNKQISALRTSIPASIAARRWVDAQQRIADLQLLVPNDPEATAWQKSLAILRIAELTSAASTSGPVQPRPAPPTQAGDDAIVARTREPGERETGTEAPASPPNPPVSRIPGTTFAPALSLPLPVTRSTPATAGLISASEILSSRIKASVGRWAYLDPNAPKPQKTEKGLVYAPELVSLDLDPNGSGELVYALKKSALDGTQGTVQFHFWLKSWDGSKLSGLSDSADRDYSLSLEPGATDLKLAWHMLKRPGLLDRRRATEGTATLVRAGTR